MSMQATAHPSLRLYVESPLCAGATIEVSDGQSHYLSHVMRRSEGDAIALFNGRDGEWLAKISVLGKRHVTTQVCTRLRAQHHSPDVWILFAPIKHGPIDFLAQKATELGVSILQPVMTQHTAVSRVNHDRLRANVQEAAEQCGRMDVPVVRNTTKLVDILHQWPQERALIFCDESGHGTPARDLLGTIRQGPLALLIGPEGGFSREEHHMIKTFSFAKPMCMGPRILRADTAALAALTCVQAWLGDWDEKPTFVTE